MEFTAAASWLNSFFAGFDSIILGFMNTLADSAGSVLTPVMKFITLLGEKGLLMFLLAFIFMLFPKTRKAGVCIFGAVCCGALITNRILKDLIARPRPFEAMARFAGFWRELGSPAESGFSFPSGHMTAITAGMCALTFTKGKKFIIPTVLVVLLMGVSRCYLMAHFPSDVLAGILVGLVSALIAWLIAKLIFDYFEDNDDLPFFEFVLYFDPIAKIPALNTLLGRDGSKVSGRRGGKRAAGHSKARRSSPSLPKLNIKLPGKAGSKSSGKHDAASSFAELPEEDDFFEEAIHTEGAESTELPKAEAATEGTSKFNLPSMPKLNIKLPQRPKRPTEDWNDRWNEYRSRKDSEKSAAQPVQPEAPELQTVPVPAEGDEDMKIAAPKARPVVEGDEDVKIAAPKAKPVVEAPAVEKAEEKAVEETDDDIPANAAPSAPLFAPPPADTDDEPVKLDADAALLAEINFRDARMAGNSSPRREEPEQPVSRRESARSSRGPSSRRGGGYRGKHEK